MNELAFLRDSVLVDAIGLLTLTQRIALVLHHDDRPPAQIAEVMGISPAEVVRMLADARRQLSAALERDRG